MKISRCCPGLQIPHISIRSSICGMCWNNKSNPADRTYTTALLQKMELIRQHAEHQQQINQADDMLLEDSKTLGDCGFTNQTARPQAPATVGLAFRISEDSKTLGDCGFTNQTARPQAPATVGLAFRISDDAFEPLRVDAFSSPPELPDVMKPQDSGSTANEQAVQ
ncbi:hypothetical protein PGIGA_G00042020 [Pangasianodon gigas]|uniref:Uncharacterized protein n=1 Tax=Pangasianodon gigas TaxID=30993 RepID=A0ACC5X0Q1_PANGG|nr:hypothetical protein [Pangasianodon gigas]